MTVNWAWDHNYYTWVCPCCGSPIPTDYYDNHPDEDPWEPPSIAICPSCGVPITKKKEFGRISYEKDLDICTFTRYAPDFDRMRK